VEADSFFSFEQASESPGEAENVVVFKFLLGQLLLLVQVGNQNCLNQRKHLGNSNNCGGSHDVVEAFLEINNQVGLVKVFHCELVHPLALFGVAVSLLLLSVLGEG